MLIASARSFIPIFCEVFPETPVSTSSKIIVSGKSFSARTLFIASIIRDSSPPDAIFASGIGRTDFPRGDFDSLIEAVKTRIFVLPKETDVYPGHGLATTVADEQLHNPYFTEFTR